MVVYAWGDNRAHHVGEGMKSRAATHLFSAKRQTRTCARIAHPSRDDEFQCTLSCAPSIVSKGAKRCWLTGMLRGTGVEKRKGVK